MEKCLRSTQTARWYNSLKARRGLRISKSKARFLGKGIELAVSFDMLGRVFDGMGNPIDGGPQIIPDKRVDINGAPINPTARGLSF